MRNDSRKTGGFIKLFLSLVIFCGTFTAMSAQKIDLSLKNVTVQQAIATLNQSENYSIILNADEVDLGKRINVTAKDASINEVLDQIFAGQNVSYVIEGNRISVTKKQPVAKPVAAAQAKNTVTGVVTDANGEPLMGAGVMVKGTTHGCVTDLDGKFVLEGVSYPVTLTVSFIGLSESEVTLSSASESPCKVSLAEDKNYLEEVVVVGYVRVVCNNRRIYPILVLDVVYKIGDICRFVLGKHIALVNVGRVAMHISNVEIQLVLA